MAEPIEVRISVATPEADLAAVVWPGVTVVYYPHAEQPEQLQAADAVISRLERLRGIRPGTVALRPLLDSAQGVAQVQALAASSQRIQAIGLGPGIGLELGDEALAYAQAECELQARALGVATFDPRPVLD